MTRSKKRKASASASQTLSRKSGYSSVARYALFSILHLSFLVCFVLFLPDIGSIRKHAPASLRDRPPQTLSWLSEKDPLFSLMSIAGGTAILQSGWACWMRAWLLAEPLHEPGSNMVEQRWIKNLRNAWITTILATFLGHVILVLFGAPITSHVLHTLALAFLVALLTVYTPAYSLGVPSLASDSQSLVRRSTWIRLFAELSASNHVEKALLYPAIGTVFGCWCGAFPIALDWGRPWQAWPLTPAFGAILGYMLASIYAILINIMKSTDKVSKHA